MAVRHWHSLKIVIVWIIDLALILAFWFLASPYRGSEKALATVIGLIVSLPAFVITWKWATGKQKPIDSHPIERAESPPVIRGIRPSLWIEQLRWGQIISVMIVALAGGVGGYLYKQSTIFDYGHRWTDISGKNPPTQNRYTGHLPDGVTLTAAYTKSLPKDTLIEFKNVKTEVKFATALFNRDWDAELIYRINLESEAYGAKTSGQYTVVDAKPIAANQVNTECDFYLTFSLYDKDGIFLVGLIGSQDTFTVGVPHQFQGSAGEEIPAQMARRTTRIERDVMIQECLQPNSKLTH